MVTKNNLFALCKKEGILIDNVKLPIHTKGIFIADDEFVCIGIDESQCKSEAEYKCVLAEEIGHYYTCPKGYDAVHKHESLSRRLYVEQKGRDWALHMLIPTLDLLRLHSQFRADSAIIKTSNDAVQIRKKHVNIQPLYMRMECMLFGVTPTFLIERYKLYYRDCEEASRSEQENPSLEYDYLHHSHIYIA